MAPWFCWLTNSPHVPLRVRLRFCLYGKGDKGVPKEEMGEIFTLDISCIPKDVGIWIKRFKNSEHMNYEVEPGFSSLFSMTMMKSSLMQTARILNLLTGSMDTVLESWEAEKARTHCCASPTLRPNKTASMRVLRVKYVHPCQAQVLEVLSHAYFTKLSESIANDYAKVGPLNRSVAERAMMSYNEVRASSPQPYLSSPLPIPLTGPLARRRPAGHPRPSRWCSPRRSRSTSTSR